MSISNNLAAVQAEIKKAAISSGRDPSEILLVAATKTQTAETVRAAIAAGISICGENRVQELVEKQAQNAYDGASVHFIGHLQRNKVRQVVGKVNLIESVDSLALLELIEKQAASLGICQDILLEVNIGREPAKSGVLPEELDALVSAASKFPHICLRGLMAIPPIASFPGENRDFFRQMYQLFVDMKQKTYDNNTMLYLSMGMSGDFADAIAEGANMVRIGTALFGPRMNRQR
ncbi:MAG: YggS family pyridoxal phosphate-dependent enzyme [Oscillospiraceae bacterium]|nr:YggS family pyridoxal phosphate-dependent enzyme [Oscillospiraceae bacterium]